MTIHIHSNVLYIRIIHHHAPIELTSTADRLKSRFFFGKVEVQLDSIWINVDTAATMYEHAREVGIKRENELLSMEMTNLLEIKLYVIDLACKIVNVIIICQSKTAFAVHIIKERKMD